MTDFERLGAIAFCLREFFRDVQPSAAAHRLAACALDPENIRLARDEPDREPVDRKDVERLQRHGVVTAKHVLVAQKIGEVGGQGLADAFVRMLADPPAAQLEPEQLARIEKFPVMPIPPAVEAFGLVALRNGIIRNELRTDPFQFLRRLGKFRQVLRIRSLEQPTFSDALRVGFRQVVFDGEQAVVGRFPGLASDPRIAVQATRAVPCGNMRGRQRLAAGGTRSWMPAILRFKDLSAMSAGEDICGMANVLGDQMAGKEIMILSTRSAAHRLDPKKILRLRQLAGFWTGRLKEVPDLLPQMSAQCHRRFGVCGEIKILNFLPHDPPRHWIDIGGRDRAPQAVRFDHRCPSAHERIEDMLVAKMMGAKEGLFDCLPTEFRQQQRPKKRSGSPRKPLMDGDQRTVILLNLFFRQRHPRDKGNLEIAFDHVVFDRDLPGRSVD